MDKLKGFFVKYNISLWLSLFCLYGILQLLHITCPILYLTGISCAGCGMTRAWFSLLKLDFKSAFYYHPLFWVPPIVVLIFLLRNKMPDRLFRGLMVSAVILFVCVYIIRLCLISSPIVVFEPENGLIYKIFSLPSRQN